MPSRTDSSTVPKSEDGDGDTGPGPQAADVASTTSTTPSAAGMSRSSSTSTVCTPGHTIGIQIKVKDSEPLDASASTNGSSPSLTKPKAIKKWITKEIWSRLICELREDSPNDSNSSSAEPKQSEDGKKIVDLCADLQQYGKIFHIGCGTLVLVLQCTSMKDSDDLMNRLKDGSLQELVQESLVTESLKQDLGLKKLVLSVDVDDSEYLFCRRQLSGRVHVMTVGVRVDTFKGSGDDTPKAVKRRTINERLYHKLGDKSERDESVQRVLSKEMMEGDVREIWPGCAYISVELENTESAKKLQQKMENGELKKAFEDALVTDDLKKECGLSDLSLAVTGQTWEQQMCLEELEDYGTEDDRDAPKDVNNNADELDGAATSEEEEEEEEEDSEDEEDEDDDSYPTKPTISAIVTEENLKKPPEDSDDEDEDEVDRSLLEAATGESNDMAGLARKQRISSAELLVCPICLEKLKDLRLLPCHHSVCVECLSEHISVTATAETFKCPTCRRACKVPKGGAKAMPHDLMASKLIDILATQVDRRCKNWSPEKPHLQPTSYCFTCDNHLCSNCHDNHRMSKELRLHHVICMEEPEDPINGDRRKSHTVTVAKCRIHKEKIITMYCTQCDDVECPTCVQQLHKGHTCKKISDVPVEFSKKLNVLFEGCIVYVAHINKLLSELQDTEKDIAKDNTMAVKVVSASADNLWNNVHKMRKTIREKQERFLERVKAVQNDALQQVKTAEKILGDYKQRAVALQTQVETVRRLDQGYKKVTRTLEMEEELQELKTSEVPGVTWSATARYNKVSKDHFKSKNQKVIGNISVNSTVTKDRTPERTKPVDDPLYILPLKSDGKYAVCGFAVTNTHIYVVHYYEPRVWVYDFTDPTKDSTLKVPNMEEPVGMVCLDTDPLCLVITDNAKKIHFVTLTEDQKVDEHKVIKTPYIPGSVTANGDNQLVIASSQGDKVVIMDENGKRVRDVPLSKHMFRWLRYAVAVESGFLLVDGGNNQVFWADDKGLIKHTYGTNKDDKLSAPKCAIEDNQGRTIVADFLNDSIHLIGPDHTRLQYLVTSREGDKIHRPGCLHLDLKNGLLFMSHGFVGFQEIRIYSYPVHHLPLTQYPRILTGLRMDLTLNKIQEW